MNILFEYTAYIDVCRGRELKLSLTRHYSMKQYAEEKSLKSILLLYLIFNSNDSDMI